MLVEFSIENFRVFHTRQTLSLVVDSNASGQSHNSVIKTGFSVAPDVHHQAGIFGANGAGKTSLVAAMSFMRHIVQDSFSESPDDLICEEPISFKFEEESNPSVFELVFIDNDTLYEYGFSITRQKVLEEWLEARSVKAEEATCVFSREYDPTIVNDYKWYFDPDYIDFGIEYWPEVTRPNALFLSVAVRLNLKSLKNIYHWITKQVIFVNSLTLPLYRLQAARLIRSEEKYKTKFIEYLRRLDIEIDDIIVNELKNVEGLSFVNKLESLNGKQLAQLQTGKTYEIFLVRLDKERKRINIPLEKESTGVGVVFDMGGVVLTSIEKGQTVVVDEMNNGIHPLAFRELISMYDDTENCTNSAQIIFTSHDVTIPDYEIIDRDQVWLIERDSDQSSSLFSYSDTEDNSSTPFYKKYFQGQFGAIPLIS